LALLGAAVALELGPDTGEYGEHPIIIKREPHHVLFLSFRFGSGAYSAKLLNGTKQRLSV
jgi:hypothetical protein